MDCVYGALYIKIDGEVVFPLNGGDGRYSFLPSEIRAFCLSKGSYFQYESRSFQTVNMSLSSAQAMLQGVHEVEIFTPPDTVTWIPEATITVQQLEIQEAWSATAAIPIVLEIK